MYVVFATSTLIGLPETRVFVEQAARNVSPSDPVLALGVQPVHDAGRVVQRFDDAFAYKQSTVD